MLTVPPPQTVDSPATVDPVAANRRARRRARIGIVAATALVAGCGFLLVRRADSHINRASLDGSPKGVTVVAAVATHFRPTRRYVGTIQPWIQARVGPQLISGYVDTVLVRPGESVKRGQVIATLDCRNASASSRALAMQARAVQTEQEALAHEANRIAELKEGGFASPNEIERHAAESASKGAQLMETQARMQRASLEVNDCVLRAPFSGEVAARFVDPGAFVHPGAAVVILIDRNNVRVTAEVPENDFDLIAPGTPVRVRARASNRRLQASIARRSPSADGETRTLHLEIDIPNADRSLPVGTTVDLAMDVGQFRAATEIPLAAAAIRGSKATMFVVEGERAARRVIEVIGEADGSLFVAPELRHDTQVVTEGRALLKEGDRVQVSVEKRAASSDSDATRLAGTAL